MESGWYPGTSSICSHVSINEWKNEFFCPVSLIAVGESRKQPCRGGKNNTTEKLLDVSHESSVVSVPWIFKEILITCKRNVASFPCCFLDYSSTSVDSRGLVGPPPSANGTRRLSWQLTDNWFWFWLATAPCHMLFTTAVLAYNTNYYQNHTSPGKLSFQLLCFHIR